MRVVVCVLAVLALGCQANRALDIDARIQEIMDLIRRDEMTTPTEKKCDIQADIAFILDSSSSIKPDDYDKMKKFVKKVIKSFDVGQDKVRIAIISFNQYFNVQMYLDQAKNVGFAVNRVEDILATSSGTYTHKALQAARTMVFQPSVGDRRDAPNIAFVVTDGRSSNQEETKEEARKLRKHGVTVFSIGVGKWLSDQELQVIATKPASRFSYLIDTFDGLDGIREGIQNKACETAANIPPPIPECEEPLFDFAFILDASSSVNADGFRQMKEFVDSIISSFEISPSTTRVALIVFDQYANVEFNLDEYDSYNPMKKALAATEQKRTGTATHKALALARTEVFTKTRDGPKAEKVAVLLTDGKSREPELTEKEALELRLSGVKIFAVGVGNAKIEELKLIATKPDYPYNIHVTKYEELQTVFADMVRATCKDDYEPDSSEDDVPNSIGQPLANCDGIADVLFLVEIPFDDDDYKTMRRYMESMVERLDIAKDKLRMAVTVFAKKVFPIVTLREEATKTEIVEALADFQLPGQRRVALDTAFSTMDVMADLGWRRNLPRILVSVFIGSPDTSLQHDLLTKFEEIRGRNLESIVVNIGKPWEEGVRELASSKKDAIFVPRLDALGNSVEQVAGRICEAMHWEK